MQLDNYNQFVGNYIFSMHHLDRTDDKNLISKCIYATSTICRRLNRTKTYHTRLKVMWKA